MRKITVTILSLLGCSACILSSAAVLRAQNRQANAEQISQSGQNQTTSSSLPTQLLSPQSYEEYLHLDAPTDVAVTGNYTAIADGEQVFLYDREENEYFSYAHTTKVTKLQFDLSETLYFLDEDMRLYTLDPQTVETADASAVKTELSCTTFLIQENDFYYTVESGGQAKISKTTLSALGISSDTLVEGITPGPTVAYYNGELYYSSGRELWKYNPAYDNVEYVATCPHLSKISAMTIHSGTILICSEAEKSVAQAKNLFAYSLAELDEKANSIDATLLPTDEEGGYFSLSVHGEYVYAVKNNAVRQYDVTTNNFTSYEICDRSDSVHRLNDGTESCLIGDLLLIADNGNDRISVYNVTARTYQTPIESTLDCQYLASDGKTVLSASDSVAILYSLQEENYGQKLATFNGFDAALTGAVGVYGKYYFVTSDHRYVAENTENGWTLSAPHRANVSATLLTADAYGYLYVAGGGNVYKYTEEQFFIDAQREKVCEEFPTSAEKMLVDYAGNLYALKDGALEKIGGEGYPLNTPLVYTDTAKLRSFAFGIEENVTYLLYDEDYLATTTLLDLPTVQKIAVENADERIFAKESAVFAVVETKPNTLVVRFDIEKLSGAELFPYLSYERRSEPFIALKIGESAQYNVLAVYDETQEEYFTCLALADFCDSADAYCTNYETAQTGYLTNDVSLYKFPYLTDLLTVTKTAGGKKITLLGEVEKLDYKYYHAQYETEDGQTVTGYIPVNYVTSFDGAPPKVETVVTENQTDGMDMLWRCCYLVLGFSVIAILTDVLILRKRKKDD